MPFDLALRGGRVIDPSQGIDAVMDVGFHAGRVAGLGAGLEGKTVHDVTGLIVTPGSSISIRMSIGAARRSASIR